MFRRRTAAVLGMAVALAASAQSQTSPIWTRVGGYTVNLGLAGPATGPVRSVWYLAGGSRLQVETASGRIFETTDFQHWQLNTTDAVPPRPALPGSATRPESGVQIATPGVRRYSMTQNNVYSSDDGRVWVNLTGFNGLSIIGDGFSSLAVSPSNAMDIAAANEAGVWRSLDGGLSWQSLNEDLPNLAARSLTGQRAVVLATPNETLAVATAGIWDPTDGFSTETTLRARVAEKYEIAATAAAQSGSFIYAGTADGKIFVIADSTASPVSSLVANGDAVSRIWIDPANPQAALAAAGSRLYRTTNGGKFWDPVAATLNAGTIHGVTADSSAGVVYVAADRGVFSGHVSLTSADQAQATWTSVLGNLPIAAAWDARLNPDGTLTVLLDGYGVWETPAPHRIVAPRIVNGADLSDRAAAPGSLISVLGANVKQAVSGRNAYPVLLATDQSSQLQVPFEVSPGALQLAVTGEGGNVWTAPLNVKQVAPAIFVDADGTPMIQDARSGLVIDASSPLRAGAVIQVLATGLGRVTPEWPTGVAAPVDSPPVVVAPVTAFLDGNPIQVNRATLAPTLIGNYLVELQIPTIVNRGANELRIVVNGEESNSVRLFVESDSLASIQK